MADNPVFEAGTARLPLGTTIAADDIGAGVLVQRVKPVWGADGVAHDVNSLTADALPVNVRNAISLSAGVTVASLTVTVKNGLVSLTGSYVDAASNALRVSITGAIGVASLVSLTGSFINSAANALNARIVDTSGNAFPSYTATPPAASDRRFSIWTHPEWQFAGPTTLSALGLTLAFADTSNLVAMGIQLTGTWAGDVFFESNVDLLNYVSHDAIPASGNTVVNQTTANGVWFANVAGANQFRLRASLSSGAVVATLFGISSGTVRQATGAAGSGSLVSLTGSYIDGTTNTITTSLTGASRLASLTGTVSVNITSIGVPVSLTGSFIDGVTNTITTSLTGASRLVSITATVSVQITSFAVPASLTGSFIDGVNNAIRVITTLTVSVAVTSIPAVSLTGSYVDAASNALRVSLTSVPSHLVSLTGSIQVSGITAPISITGTVTTEQRFATPATSKLTRALISFSTTGSSTIVAGVGGQTIRVHRLMVTFAVATGVQIESSTSALTGNMTMPANGAIVLDHDGEPWFITSAADPLRLHTDTTGQVSGAVWYTQSA